MGIVVGVVAGGAGSAVAPRSGSQSVRVIAAGVPGRAGENGLPVELQATGTHLQWRHQGAIDWIDLLALSAIEGQPGVDGVPVELQASATHLQWRLVGGAEWSDLIALSAFKGADGVGVPPGGATGQVLRKKSAADHDTEWAAAAGGGGGGGGDALGSVRRFTSPPDPSIWVRGGEVLSKAEFPELYALVGDRYTRYTALAPVAITERATTSAPNHRWMAYSPTLDLFAGMDPNGVAVYSADGVNWSAGVVTGFASSGVNMVSWLGDRFVALGNSSLIATSTDGINWTGETIGSSLIWNDAEYTGINFIIVGSSGALRTSATGAAGSWVTRTSTFTTNEIKAIINLGGGVCVITGAAGKIAYSTDHGVTWTAATSGTSTQQEGIVRVPSNGVLLTYTTASSALRASADNGVTWTAYGAALPGSGYMLVEYAGAIYATSSSAPTLVLDPVGLTWTASAALPDVQFRRITDIPARNIRLAVLSTTAMFSFAGGGFQTTRYPITGSNTVFSRAGGKLFAVTASVPGIAVSADDGVTWVRVLCQTWTGSNARPVVVESGGVFLCHMTTSQLWRSSDGYSWTRVAGLTMASSTGPCVAAADGKLYAVITGTGAIHSSVDGIAWTPDALPLTGGDLPANLLGVGDVLVAIATTGVMYLRRSAAGAWEAAHTFGSTGALCVVDNVVVSTYPTSGIVETFDIDSLLGAAGTAAVGSGVYAVTALDGALASNSQEVNIGVRVSFDLGQSWFLLNLPPFVSGGAVTLMPGKACRIIDTADGIVAATNYCAARYESTIPGTSFAAPWAPPGHYVRAVA